MRKLIRLSNKKGFTVIELLMAIVILGVVMAAITTMIVQSFNVFDSSTRRMSAGQLAELGLSEVGGYLKAIKGPIDISEYDTNLDPASNKTYNFNGFYNGESADISIEYRNDVNKLILSIDGTTERTILNNVRGFYIDIDELAGELTGDFDIFIKVEDDRGNIAEKRLNISSRNI